MTRTGFRPRVRLRLCAALVLLFFAGGIAMAFADTAADLTAARAAALRRDDSVAIRLFTRALARPDLRGAQRAGAYVDRSAVFERQKNYAGVISDLQHAIALKPDDWVAYYGLGLAYHLNGEPQLAIDVYSLGLALAYPDVALLNGRGRAYHATGDDGRARADFERAIALNPQYQFPYRNLGLLEYSQERYDAAFADFDRLVQLDPEHAEGYQLRGAMSFLRKQPAAALADLSQAIALDPTCLDAYRWRGLVNFVNREFSDAAADFAAATRLRPAAPYNELWAYISRLKLKTADAAQFRTASARFDKRTWPGPIFALLLGEQTYSDVLALGTTGVPAATAAGHRCEAAFYAGELALSRDDLATARPLFDEALKTCPVHDTEHDGAVAELGWLGAQPKAETEPRMRNLDPRLR